LRKFDGDIIYILKTNLKLVIMILNDSQTAFIWLKVSYGPVAGSCGHGSESSGSVKCGELLD
jgi:hypothetical protein